MATLAELLVELDSHVNRTDPDYTDNRAKFLNRGLRWAQRRLLPEVGRRRQWQSLDPDTGASVVTLGATSLEAPSDYRPSGLTRLFYLDGDTRVPLRRIPEDWLYQPFFDPEESATQDFRDPTQQGTPRYFAILARVFEFRPAADRTYTLELHGLAYFADLVDPEDSNVLTVEAEDLALYAGLRACWQFFGDAAALQFWTEQAKDAALDFMTDRAHEASTAHSLVMETPG